jgi:serpin B
MAKVLHFPEDDATTHQGISKISADLLLQAKQSQQRFKKLENHSRQGSPLELQMANRLFGQKGYAFESPFLKTLADTYGAPMQPLDFKSSPATATKFINGWVSDHTNSRIKDLIPPDVIDKDTRLVLANAIRLKASWANEFSELPNENFYVNGSQPVNVPMLGLQSNFGYQKISKGVAVTIPYLDGGLQMVLLIPNSKNGLEKLEKKLSAKSLRKLATADTSVPVNLQWPQFKLAPDAILLTDELIEMGMPSAFNFPRGSANFDSIAPPKNGYLMAIQEVAHKAFIAVDKSGTEAAAATAVIMGKSSVPAPPKKVIQVKVDHPFAFAIQDTASGACLFFGRVVDPR